MKDITVAAPKEAGFQAKPILPSKVPSPVKVYTSNIGRSRSRGMAWEVPEWDFAEISRVLDTESYVRRAFRAKKNLFIKEGYSFVGQNPERIRYIKKRIEQIELSSGIPFQVLVSQIVSSLVRQQNAIVVKVRNDQYSGGKIRFIGNKEVKPVAAYFLMPMESLKIKRNEFGDIVKYAQEIYGKEAKEFDPNDIIHFYLDKREGFSVGTPILVPVKDDIRALRRIEENVELLVYQHLFPLFHYQVGTDEAPAATYADGSNEVDIVRLRIAQMPSDGCWVTPERHTITPLVTGSAPIAVERVIEHFKQRIFSGLGVSSVDMGEGGTSSRSTADTMSRNLIDDTKADQSEFAAQFYAYVIQELLMESTFSETDLFTEENKVFLKFNEIDFESLLAKENHYTDIFLKNAITHPELREAIGREPFKGQGWATQGNASEDWMQTSYGLLDRDKLVLQAIDEPGTAASLEEAKSRTSSNKMKLSGGLGTAGGNAVAAKNTPSNQHGVRSAPKINRDFVENEITANLFRRGWQTSNIYESISSDVLRSISKDGFDIKKVELNLGIALEEAKDRLVSQASSSFRTGLTETGHDIWEVNLDFVNDKIKTHISRYTNKLREDILDKLKSNLILDSRLTAENTVFAKFVFDAFKSRVRLIDYSEVMRAYNYGLALGYKLSDRKIIRSETQNSNPCETCKKRFLEYNQTDAIIYEELPPLHPGCDCIISSEA
jgi:hypothetical protein